MEDKIKGGDMKSPEAIGAADIRDIIDNPFDLPLISEFLGKKNLIDALMIDYSLDSSGFGEFAVMEFNGSGKYRSNSQAVIDQIKSLLAAGAGNATPVNVHVAKKQNKAGQAYFSLLG